MSPDVRSATAAKQNGDTHKPIPIRNPCSSPMIHVGICLVNRRRPAELICPYFYRERRRNTPRPCPCRRSIRDGQPRHGHKRLAIFRKLMYNLTRGNLHPNAKTVSFSDSAVGEVQITEGSSQ